jgi:general secretion pathway protein C
MAQLRMRPHFQEGKPSGFVVGQVQKGGVFEAAGLKEGDIIIAINDQDVKTPNQLLKAYRDVSEDKELWLDVLRGGGEETIEVTLEGVVGKD